MTRALVLVALMSSVAFAQPAEPEPAPPADPAETKETPPEPAPPAETEAREPEPPEPEPKRRTPFDRGRFGLTAGGGTTRQFDQTYVSISAGTIYYVLDGVGIGFGAGVQWAWSGDGPTIARTTPDLRYVAQPLVGRWPLIPYVGVFYNHWFIGDAYADIDAIGTRGGLLYVSGRAVLGLGIAYEHLVSKCDATMMDCSLIYPDITIAFAL